MYTIVLFFQNLPEVEHIDLAYNSMDYFDFDYLDQVGTLASLRVNISYNKINSLVDNSSNFGFTKDHCKEYRRSSLQIMEFIVASPFSFLPFKHQDPGPVTQQHIGDTVGIFQTSRDQLDTPLFVQQ